jgi:hypothetical protein
MWNGEPWLHGKAIDEKYWTWTAQILMNQRWPHPITQQNKVDIIVRDYEGLLKLWVDPEDIRQYFKKSLKNKSFEITTYLN